jgi:hypothetical protein
VPPGRVRNRGPDGHPSCGRSLLYGHNKDIREGTTALYSNARIPAAPDGAWTVVHTDAVGGSGFILMHPADGYGPADENADLEKAYGERVHGQQEMPQPVGGIVGGKYQAIRKILPTEAGCAVSGCRRGADLVERIDDACAQAWIVWARRTRSENPRMSTKPTTRSP